MVYVRLQYATRETVPGVVTGKPPVVGGSYGREEAPGRSVAIITREAIAYYGKDIEDSTVAVQGYGSAGANATRLLDEWGASIVTVSDVNGAIYNSTGLDTQAVPSYKEEPEGVMKHDAPNTLTNAELLELDVDVVIPAAIGNSSHPATQIRSKRTSWLRDRTAQRLPKQTISSPIKISKWYPVFLPTPVA